jgi:anti-sigma factor RsiW
MNCDEAKFHVGLEDDDPRAAEMRAHIRGCAKCRADVDHQNNIRATLGLLRYERPPADFSAQCVTQIMRAVRQQPVPAPATAWWEAFRAHAAVAFQPLRLAAAAALLLGVGLYFLHTPGDGNLTGAAPAAAVVIRSEPALSSTPAATPAPPASIMLAATNSGLRMDYGPGGSVPVKYEY